MNPPQEEKEGGVSKRSKRAPAPEWGAVHPHKLIKIQLANVPPPEKWHKIQLANAPPPEKWHIPVRQSLLNKGSAASVNAKLRKNLPIDTIARKDLPKGLLSVTRNNPPIDEEGADVSVATVAAAPNTTTYLAKYGSGHLRIEPASKFNEITIHCHFKANVFKPNIWKLI